jgi:elongation of very long chain fatty acids protein 4
LTDLHEAILVLAAYSVLVTWGLIKRSMTSTAKEGAGPAAEASSPKTWADVAASFKAEPIKALQAVYNVVQVVLCSAMVLGAIVEPIRLGYSPVCNTFEVRGTSVTFLLWAFYLSKVLDFCDTFFIIWRGKWEQFSFLHVYHHMSIFAVYWINSVGGYDGDIYLTIVLNGSVHVVMYAYYFLSSIGSKPWWARHLTEMQMTQFLLMNCQAGYMLYNNCPYPRAITQVYLVYIISLFVLFMQFYLAKYAKQAKAKAAAAAASGKPKRQ